MSNLTGLVDNVYFEESRKILEKHSFGSVTDAEKNYYEKVWEAAFPL